MCDLVDADTGVMSGAMLFIKEDLGTNDTQVQALAGILNVCALVGSLTAGRVSDWVGRRLTISLAACIAPPLPLPSPARSPLL